MTIDFRAQLQSLELKKYPRTVHLEGSRLQEGDEGSEHIPYATLAGKHLVIEEKLDGGNCAVSFSDGGELLLQSRGHYLMGGGRERQFNLFKLWATAHQAWLIDRLEDRYIMYGEWLHKKHSVFYDALPHYFVEFDIWDRQDCVFLSTERRISLLAGGPVLSVPVLYAGPAPLKLKDVKALVGKSLARTERWRARFENVVTRDGLDLARAWRQCDKSDLMEGLYLKVEANGQTVDRLKWVRSDFVQAILEANQHHSEQPFIPNQLIEGVALFAPVLTHAWPQASRAALAPSP